MENSQNVLSKQNKYEKLKEENKDFKNIKYNCKPSWIHLKSNY